MTSTDCNIPDLPALSIRQPWAWLILYAGKDIENRSWRTNFRGLFLIHAAKGCTQTEYENAGRFAQAAVNDKYRGQKIPPLRMIERGGIVGIAEVVDCVEHSSSLWFMGRYGFVIQNIRPLPFTPCKGSLKFFHLNLPLP